MEQNRGVHRFKSIESFLQAKESLVGNFYFRTWLCETKKEGVFNMLTCKVFQKSMPILIMLQKLKQLMQAQLEKTYKVKKKKKNY